MRMDATVPGASSGDEMLAAYNQRLEQLRADGYQWDLETHAMVKQCATCAAPEETRDETSGTEDPSS